MVEKQFENYLKRLEVAVSSLESSSLYKQQLFFESDLGNQANGQGNVPLPPKMNLPPPVIASAQQGAAWTLPPIDEFDKELANFKNLGEQLANQDLKDITKTALTVMGIMKNAMEFSQKVKTPVQDEKIKIQQVITQEINKLEQYMRKKDVEFHAKAIKDGIFSACWIITETPEMAIKGQIESSEFHSLKFRKLKIIEHNKWYDSFLNALKKLVEYTKEHFQFGLKWNSKGDKTVANLIEAMKEQPQQSNPGGGAQAIFAEINVGDGITSRLKKVDKNQPAASQSKQTQPAQAQKKVQSTTQAVKPPKKHKINLNWFVEYYVNEKLIEFKENEINMKESIFIDNCQNTSVIVKGKVKSIFLQKCEKLNLVFDTVVSSVECIGSKNINIVNLNQCPSLVIEKSQVIHIQLNHPAETDIVSTSVEQLNVTYDLDNGDTQKDYPVPNQFITKFNSQTQKFETKVLQLFQE